MRHNISRATIAQLDDTGKLLSGEKGLSTDGLYVIDHNEEGFATLNITGIEAAGVAVWLNGQLKHNSYGKSQPVIAMTGAVDFEMKQKIKGFVKTKNGGWMRKLPKPHIAMIAESEGWDGEVYYECFANLDFIEEASNNSTDNNNEVDSMDTLNATANAPLSKDVFTDGITQEPYMIAMSDDDFDKDKLWGEVFGGYTAPASGSTQAG
ncbi:phage tail protein [Lactiplantibacillus paraxiangfangensis]|uniref:phage tail protein n=1 Tax=Lactiplantibacillus paraxiangfangensis TaxID=3076224 RepID=UPI0030C65F87